MERKEMRIFEGGNQDVLLRNLYWNVMLLQNQNKRCKCVVQCTKTNAVGDRGKPVRLTFSPQILVSRLTPLRRITLPEFCVHAMFLQHVDKPSHTG